MQMKTEWGWTNIVVSGIPAAQMPAEQPALSLSAPVPWSFRWFQAIAYAQHYPMTISIWSQLSLILRH